MRNPTRLPLPPTTQAVAFRAAVLAFALFASSADAAEHCVANANLTVPATTEGLYLNLVTGTSATTEAGVPGFDVDLYAVANTEPTGQLRFYWGPASNGGAGVASSGDIYAALTSGQLVSPASLFTRAAFGGNTSAWQAGSTAYLGMRFQNEGTGAINYGFLHLTTSAPLGFPATINGWCYESSGAAITTHAISSETVFANGFES